MQRAFRRSAALRANGVPVRTPNRRRYDADATLVKGLSCVAEAIKPAILDTK